MREKRKRNTTSTTKGLPAGEKLNRNRLLAECDLRWNWIGTEAKHISEITQEQCLRASGLASLDLRRPCPNKFVKQSRSPSRAALQQSDVCSKEPEDIIVISDEEENPPCDKKRCKDNPYCLNYLGQDKWEDEERAEESYFKLHLRRENPRSRSRGANPVGLRNLGATCYANAFLQVWFQDLAFRSGVYRCRPSSNNILKFKDSPIFQLQVTFTALQEGRLSVFNPIKLVESLLLRTSEQQDAQEFSKLFMSHLDDEFKKQSDPELQSLLSDQFEGKMVNATVCDNCKTRSERETAFLELEVNLEKTGILEDRIASILEPERLDEDNRYLCSVCESLQNATRYTEIRNLPPVLHISLLRFYYDLTTFERKKSKVPLKFPPYLNMAPFLRSADPHQAVMDVDSEEIYELRGVLLHKGPSAYHGHYEAQVYNQEAKKWYQFNDEVVTPLSSFYSTNAVSNTNSDSIVIDRDGDSTRPDKRQKRTAISRRVEDSDDEETVPTAKTKLLSSRDAYMLVYARREDPKLSNTRPLIPPPDALEIIKSSNEEHERACEEYDALREEKRLEFMKIREMMRDVYLSWHVTSVSEPSVVVSKAALEDWLLSALVPIDSKRDYQPKVDEVEKVRDAEIGPASSDLLLSTMVPSNKDSTTTTSNEPSSSTQNIIDSTNLLCPHAAKNEDQRLHPMRGREMKVISKVAHDKMVQNGFTFVPELTVESVCKRCVEEEFLEKLYQLEHPRLVAEFNEIYATASENEGFWISKAWLKDWQLNKPKMHIPCRPDPSPENVSDDPALNFRSHIYCKHDSLSMNVAMRRRISHEAVQLLRKLFRDWDPPRWNSETCPACDVDVHISKESKLEQRKIAENEKAQLYRLNNEDIFGQQGLLPGLSCAVIPSQFVHHWRKWLARPGDTPRPTDIDTRSVICEHGKLILDFSDKNDLDNDFAIVTISEWEGLQDSYNTGPLVKITCTSEIDGSCRERTRVSSELPCCTECRLKQKLDFSSAVVTVIRIGKGPIPTDGPSQTGPIRTGVFQASAFVVNGKNGTKPSVEKPNGIRQSRRLLEGKNPGRQQICIQKQWAVKDIKVAVNKAFKIPTFSQRLYYNGIELNDGSKTMADLQICNKDTFYLKEDTEDAIILDSDVEDTVGEPSKKRSEGDAFKGTLLSGGSSPSRVNGLKDDNTSPEKSSEKTCPICTLLNPPGAEHCEACETPF